MIDDAVLGDGPERTEEGPAQTQELVEERSTSFGRNTVRGTTRAFTTAEALAERKLEDLRFQHSEEAKDREAARWRARWLFIAILATSALLFSIGFALAFFSDDDVSKEFGRALVLAVFSAAVAALGGYATGRSSR